MSNQHIEFNNDIYENVLINQKNNDGNNEYNETNKYNDNNKYNNKKYETIVDGVSMYDFRHSSACYWLQRYKSESALKYRFGWKKSDMIFYYTELLGMSDNIESEDLYVDISKTELEQQINKDRTEIELLRDEITNQDAKMKEIIEIIKALQLEKIVEAR